MNGPARWVLLAYQMPREPSTPRVSIWRKLRRLGVAQLMDGLVALPLSARNHERLEWLAEEIREASGEAAIWLAQTSSLDQERTLVSQLQETVAEEYRHVATAAREAEDSEPATRRRALMRLRRDLQLIRERDYFPTQVREAAVSAVEQLAGVGEVVP
ncbi:MAG TPA: Chromate resistance protein ChrB [Actinomycetota bacterium]|nr:Chromate resistance protein ChrB [Actinomycetota bacterium]